MSQKNGAGGGGGLTVRNYHKCNGTALLPLQPTTHRQQITLRICSNSAVVTPLFSFASCPPNLPFDFTLVTIHHFNIVFNQQCILSRYLSSDTRYDSWFCNCIYFCFFWFPIMGFFDSMWSLTWDACR